MGERTHTSGSGATGEATAGSEGGEAGGAGFDQVIARLRGVVERLEAGSLSLEQALAAFEEGVRLSRRGTEILDQAERRVEQLTRAADGSLQAVPLPKASSPGDGDAPA